ncbi:N-acetylmuramidase domain-containing protein [Paraburkholderia sp. A3BS-1L]|uniref:N-acetylmuramidase domain-containing protein n=1 Tax=Paraburkholderia sp. A3BS-1L TaxID=3028375 RepID=UPI003DA9871C
MNTSTGGYQGGSAEWTRLQQAEAICSTNGIDTGLALRCASWGLFQIMGYYHTQCGFSSVEGFTNAMQTTETQQLDAFVEYVKDMNDGAMLSALVSHNLLSFAKQYNGSGEAKNNYHSRLAQAYAQLIG